MIDTENEGFTSDSIHVQTFLLVMSNLLPSATSLFYWLMITWMFTSDTVGIAQSIISAVGWFCLFLSFGVDETIRRYVPEIENKSKFINSAIATPMIIQLLAMPVLLIMLGLVDLNFIFIFSEIGALVSILSLAIGNTAMAMQNMSFTGLRRNELLAGRRILYGILQILLVALLSFLGVYGILIGSSLAAWIVVFIGFGMLYRALPGYRIDSRLDMSKLFEKKEFSAGTYIGKLVGQLPRSFMPAAVLAILSASEAAYFALPWALVGFLNTAAGSMGVSFMVESVARPEKRSSNLRAILFLWSFLILPAVLAILFFGDLILGIFGQNYAGGHLLFIYLAVSVVPYSINNLFYGLAYIKENTLVVVLAKAVVTAITFGVSMTFLISVGIAAVGIAWLLGNGVVMVAIILYYLKGVYPLRP